MDPLEQPGVETAKIEAPGADVTPAPEAPTTTPETTTETTTVAPAEDAAAKAEQDEWDAAANEIFPGIKSTNKPEKKEEPKKEEDKPGEPAKPKEEPKKEEAKPAAPVDKKPEPKPGASDDTKAKGDEAAGSDEAEADQPDTSALDARIAARQQTQAVDAVKADVRKEMFADVPTELRDADGDPIKSIEDVTKLINPRTQKPFTDEEAGMWLLSAQQQFNTNLANIDKQVEQIAEVNMDLKDQADMVNYRYGALLKEMPELRDKLWARYQNTLVKDPKSGIITKAPVSLEEFYETALEPYAVMGRDAEAKETAAKAASDKAAADAKAAEEAKKIKTRQDRSDIFGGGKVDDMSDEDKEWNAAATAVFGPKK